MKRKRPTLKENPPPFKCLNCDGPIDPQQKQIHLYCTQLCSDEAKFVRYYRACRADGRIKKRDVLEAIQIRLAHIMTGGYDSKRRFVPHSLRKAVFERDHGTCQKCGEPGADIDHILDDSNALENLQLLCKQCHNAKTKEQIVEILPGDVLYRSLIKKEKALRFRGNAPFPLRICDDEKRWPKIYQRIMVIWGIEKRIRLAESLLQSLD